MLTNGAKALINVEGGETNMKVQWYESLQNERAHIEALDLLLEIMEKVVIKTNDDFPQCDVIICFVQYYMF